MQSYIDWALALPRYITIPIYLFIGVLVGINYRFFIARHVWKKHQAEDRPEKGCWCATSAYTPFISFGDFVAFGTWTAPISWPIHLPIGLVVFLFRSYGGTLRFFHNLAQKGAKKMFLQHQTEKELRKELEEVTKSYEMEKRERERYAGLRDECEKTISSLNSQITQFKAKKPDDIRFDELMDKSAKLIDRADARMPGEVP